MKSIKLATSYCVTITNSFHDLIKVRIGFNDFILNCLKYNVACKQKIHVDYVTLIFICNTFRKRGIGIATPSFTVIQNSFSLNMHF